MKLRAFGIVGILVLTGCATQPGKLPAQSRSGDVAVDELYIRGVFNWWEARENHRLDGRGHQSSVDVDLIADGQPNDFKFSNQYWSPSQTCGGSFAGQLVSTSSTLYLTCGPDAQNLQFTPTEDGTYRFIINHGSNDELTLSVIQIN